ncbi:uncharacterized protein [Clytia hemisphaerica]|uniref:uncharacterized protein n=1 Tax=Clytia hemisphaerica TaxID=252671 RepID=UPI0034D3A2B5
MVNALMNNVVMVLPKKSFDRFVRLDRCFDGLITQTFPSNISTNHFSPPTRKGLYRLVVAFQCPKSVSRPSPSVILVFCTRPPSRLSYTILFVFRTRRYLFFVDNMLPCRLKRYVLRRHCRYFSSLLVTLGVFFNISSLTCLSIDWSKDQLRVSYYVMAFRFSCHSWLSQYHVFTYNPF